MAVMCRFVQRIQGGRTADGTEWSIASAREKNRT